MTTSGFADIYTQSMRAAGPRASGVYMSKIPHSCGLTIKIPLCAALLTCHSGNIVSGTNFHDLAIGVICLWKYYL